MRASHRNTLICVLLLALVAMASAQSDAPARYSVRPKHVPFTWSDYAEARSPTPINRSYEQLTPVEKQRIKDRYVGMSEADEPPFPRDGLEPLLDAISQAYGSLARRQIEGLLDIEVVIDSPGSATAVNVYKSPDAKLLKLVASIALLTKYKPGVCEGAPCRMAFRSPSTSSSAEEV